MRLLIIFIVVAVLLVVPFILFGETFDAWLAGDAALEWLESHGAWAWAMAVALLLGDLVLPVPASAVMAALGIIYGPVIGGLVGAAGSFIAGFTGYAACRIAGRSAALKLAGEKDLARGEKFFARSGGWAIVLSRWLPLMPEVVACLAGLARMPAGRFTVALACGCLPVAITFATLGFAGADRPVLALVLCAVIPVALWAVAGRLVTHVGRGDQHTKPG